MKLTRLPLYFSILLFALIMVSCSILRKGVADKRTLSEKIAAKDFTITMIHCNPSNFRDGYLSNDTEIKLKNDTVSANLPFFGVVNTAPMDGLDSGIVFEKKIKDISIKEIPSKGWHIEFKVKNAQYNYQFLIEITNEGKSTVVVTCPERSTMSYYGEIMK